MRRVVSLITAFALALQASGLAVASALSRDGNGNVTAHAYYRDVGFYQQESKTYTYDDANRLTLVNYGGGGMTNVEFEYDDADRMTEMTDATGTTIWEYLDGDLIEVDEAYQASRSFLGGGAMIRLCI